MKSHVVKVVTPGLEGAACRREDGLDGRNFARHGCQIAWGTQKATIPRTHLHVHGNHGLKFAALHLAQAPQCGSDVGREFRTLTAQQAFNAPCWAQSVPVAV